MNRDETVYLKHIRDAILRVESYVDGIDEDAFLHRHLVQDGVIRQIEIIGEAVKHLDREFRALYRDVPWQDIAGTRDKLIHDYFGVDLEKVWLMVTQDIPVLKVQIQKILDDLTKS